jgi:soluble P-type ATPase
MTCTYSVFSKDTEERRMIRINIPGFGLLEIKNLVTDLNGTITDSGRLIPGALSHMKALKESGIDIYVVSGDTRGVLGNILAQDSGIETVLTTSAEGKRAFVEEIGPGQTVCIGNGNIDVEMFKVARLSICTIQAEGAATRAMLNADIVVPHITDALKMLLDHECLVATLRH